MIIEWLYTRTIPEGIYFLFGLIVKHKSKHADEGLYRICSPFVKCMEDNFGIAMGIELMALITKLFLYFSIIIHFTVEGDVQVVKALRLLTAFRKVDDAKAAMSKPDRCRIIVEHGITLS